MRKLFLVAAATLLLAAPPLAGNAEAQSMRGRFALSGKIGITNPADSEMNTPAGRMVVDTDAGVVGGVGLLFGLDDEMALELELSRSSFDTDGFGDADITNISVGAQYRLMERERLVPYGGAGLDVLVNDLGNRYTKTTVGAHLSAGVDYLASRQMALNLELKGVGAFEVDADGPNGARGKFDPSSISATIGARFFFR